MAPPCDDPRDVVQTSANERALSIFEAFLRHARGDEKVPAPRVHRVEDPPPESLDSEITRVVHAPTRPQSELPSWDDRTEESAGPSKSSPEERTDLTVNLPPAPQQPASPHEERSIIIDDDSLTSPEMSRDGALGVGPSIAAMAQNALDTLLQEMAVLVKYGHAAQAAQELELWATSHPDDLSAHLRVAEFEMARVDRELALQRYGTLVALFLDRGDSRSADDVIRRLRRDMPGDPRVTAIAQWNGLT